MEPAQAMALAGTPRHCNHVRFAKGQTAAQRETLMQAVLMVRMAAGPSTKADDSFVKGLAFACRINRKRFGQIAARVIPV